METPLESVRLMEMMELEIILPLFDTVPGLMTITLTTAPSGRLAVVLFGKVTDPATIPSPSMTSKGPSGISEVAV
jgi:hypothetical protein